MLSPAAAVNEGVVEQAIAVVVSAAPGQSNAPINVCDVLPVSSRVPATVGRVRATVPSAPVGGDIVIVPLVALLKPTEPTVDPANPNTGAVVYVGAAELPVAFPRMVPAAALAKVAVTVPLVVTALEGVLLSTVPSPVKVTLLTVALLVLQVAQVIFPVAVVMPSGAEAVTAGVPDEVPAVQVGVPAAL